jgi:hypothetical protein
VLGGIRIPLSACNTTTGFDNQLSLLCTEAETEGAPRLRPASAPTSLSTLLGRGNGVEGADDGDTEIGSEDDDELARGKGRLCERRAACEPVDEVLGASTDWKASVIVALGIGPCPFTPYLTTESVCVN